MTPDLREKLLAGLKDGSIVPYLGPGVLADVKNAASGAPIPADSNSLIYAMNDGKPMAPKLMYEFPRAAMNVEVKRGRSAVTRFLNRTYGETAWTRAAVHDWIKAIFPHYVIDINRDTQLQDSYAVSIPPEVKELRKGKQYLLIGLRLNRDTERMVMSDMIYAAAQPAGWVLIQEPTEKERRFCKKLGLELIEANLFDLIRAAVAA